MCLFTPINTKPMITLHCFFFAEPGFCRQHATSELCPSEAVGQQPRLSHPSQQPDNGGRGLSKICGNYRVCPPSLNTMGMSSPFNSFQAHHQPTSLSAMAGVGYPPPPNPQSAAGMGHASALYTAQDSMCVGGTASLGLPMWK